MEKKLIANNRIVFVTGASRGIGKAIADAFAKSGYLVVYGYHKTPVKPPNDSCLAVAIDVSDRISIEKALNEIFNYYGKFVSILINNAAVAQEKPFLTISDDDWDLMFKTNLKGPFILTKLVLPSMLECKWGRIINISSIGGQWGGFNQVHYAASKSALINFTQSIAKIFSSQGVTSNAISPGLVLTDMSSNELSTKAGKDKLNNIPVGRLGTVYEIADVALFLATDNAAYITGQTINVNGGMYFG